MRRLLRFSLSSAAIVAFGASETNASAADRFVDRPDTLQQLEFAGDVGLGVGHTEYRRYCGLGCTGAGLNLEGVLGATDHVEVGLRTGVRLGDEARASGADAYGRTLWTETYGTGGDPFANPELRVRGNLYRGNVAEVSLEGRLYLPFETGTRIGMMFGVPLAFHISDFLRIDTGVYTPVLFYDPTLVAISIPAYFWFQVSNSVWLGPMTALRAGLNRGSDADLLLGFGLGVQVARSVDLKTMLIFPNADDGPGRQFGAGFGVQFRIGD